MKRDGFVRANMDTKLLYGLAGYIVQQGLGLRKIKWIKIKN